MTEKQMEDYNRLKEQKKKQLDRQNQYNKQNYERLNIVMRPGDKNRVRAAAKSLGARSVNEYVVGLIYADLERLEESPENVQNSQYESLGNAFKNAQNAQEEDETSVVKGNLTETEKPAQKPVKSQEQERYGQESFESLNDMLKRIQKENADKHEAERRLRAMKATEMERQAELGGAPESARI